jgi:CBS domain-containing protein
MTSIKSHFTFDVIGLNVTATCREAAQLMVRHRVGAAAVRDGDRTIGLVTERDLVARVVAGGLSGDRSLAEVVRCDLPAIPASTSDAECAELMRRYNTRHLLVADGPRVLGIISMRDVIALMLDEKEVLIDQLRAYIQGG